MLSLLGFIHQQWFGLPKNIFFMLLLILIAIICFLFNRLRFSRNMKISPTKLRKATAADGHKCSCTLEVEVDNWLHAQRIPHNKPESAKEGEFYSKINGVPNFVCYKMTRELNEIHSIIEIEGIPRLKNIKAPIKASDIEPKYRRLLLNADELIDARWQDKAQKFYRGLRRKIMEFAKKEGIRLIDLHAEYLKDGKIKDNSKVSPKENN